MCFFVTWKQKGNSDKWGNDLKRLESEEQEKITEKKNDKISQLKEVLLPFPPKYWNLRYEQYLI